MRIRKLLRVRFVVDPFTEQEKIMAEKEEYSHATYTNDAKIYGDQGAV